MKRVFCILIVAIYVSSNCYSQHAIDGEFAEWTDSQIVARDQIDDASGNFDLKNLSAVQHGSELYLNIEIAQPLNLQSGVKSDGTLILNVESKDRQLDLDFRNRSATRTTGSKVEAVPWLELGFECLPSFASKSFEMKFDIGDMDATPTITFSGSDSFDKPVVPIVAVVEKKAPIQLKPKSTSTTIRIANQNTLHNELADKKRQQKFKRLFAAVDADVYWLPGRMGPGGVQPGFGSNNANWNESNLERWLRGCDSTQT